jgi:Tol biopolymer transport system component
MRIPPKSLLPVTTCGGRCWSLFFLVAFFDACGSRSGGPPPPPPSPVPDIAFASRQALDGSDATNTNSVQNIWVVHADGTGAVPLTRLAANGVFTSDPAWSPDKAEIAFVSNRAQDGSDGLNSTGGSSWIWTMDVDGSHQVPLTTYVTDGSGHWLVTSPAWSPDGMKLSAVSICCLDLYSNVAVLNSDGSNFTELTSFGGPQPATGTGSGRWSPSGLQLIFDAPGHTAALGPPQNIWVMNVDGSAQTALTSLTNVNARSFDPNWSPDASEVAFSSSRALDGSDAVNTNGTINIWLMKADGTGVKPLTKLNAGGADCGVVSWSPDGTKLVFESARALDGSDAANANMTVNIWVANADGTGAIPLTNLTAPGASSHNAAWSPDGSKLAFDSFRAIDGGDLANGASNIWIMDPDGSGATPLTKNSTKGADSVQPKWRP